MGTVEGAREGTVEGAPDDAHHPHWVELGTVGSWGRARVDRRGSIVPVGAPWSLDWWIGAEDRWHRNRDDGVVRQHALERTPVIVSGLRVPGGEIEQRAWAVADPRRSGGGSALVVEFTNATAVPVALALALAPSGGAIGAIGFDGRTVQVDDVDAVTFSKVPSRMAWSDGLDDPFALVTGDRAGSKWPDGGVRSANGTASAAFVFPLPHTATLRVVMPLHDSSFDPDGGSAPIDPSSVPDVDRIVSGWTALTERAPRFELPERRLEEVVALAQRHLVVQGAALDDTAWPRVDVDGCDGARRCMALDDAGFHSQSQQTLRAAIDLQVTNGSFEGDRLDATAAWLVAMQHHAALSGDDSLARDAVGPIAMAAHWLHRRAVGRRLSPSTRFFGRGVGPIGFDDDRRRAYDARWTARAFRAAIDLLRSVEQPDAADLVERHAIDLALAMGARGIELDGPGSAAVPHELGAELRALVAEGEPLSTWSSAHDGHDPMRTVEFLRLVRGAVVDDADGSVAMVPALDDGWFGQPLAVHDLPTALGRLSFAIRWHGTRPALLWDLVPHDGVAIELRIPGLDPDWSSREPRGESLLREPMIPSHIHVHDHRHFHDADGDAVDGVARPVAEPPDDAGGSFS